MAEKSEIIEIEGMAELKRKLDRLLTSDPQMEEKIRQIVKDVINQARHEVSDDVKTGLQMKSDPRQSYRAVRSLVYRQILGGNLNILRKKKAGASHEMPSPSPKTGRGGNRRVRGDRTKALQSYWGADRGFVLRFLNDGTRKRSIRNFAINEKRKVDKWNKNPNTGNRGSITARNWFGSASYQALQNAAANLTAMVEQLIAERFSES